MARFEHAISVLLRHEGGYAPDDVGVGPVNYGITQRTLTSIHEAYPTQAQELGLPRKVEELTREQAEAFYRAFYWDRGKYEKLEDQRIATLLFSLAVNMGPVWPALFCQCALGRIGPAVRRDGILGPETIRAINSLDETGRALLICSVKHQAIERYEQLYRRNAQRYAHVIDGWRRRIAEL